MPDPARGAFKLAHDTVAAALATSLQPAPANPDSDGDEGLPDFEAVLAAIRAYLPDPDPGRGAPWQGPMASDSLRPHSCWMPPTRCQS